MIKLVHSYPYFRTEFFNSAVPYSQSLYPCRCITGPKYHVEAHIPSGVVGKSNNRIVIGERRGKDISFHVSHHWVMEKTPKVPNNVSSGPGPIMKVKESKGGWGPAKREFNSPRSFQG